MTDDPFASPEWAEFADDMIMRLVPQIDSSAICLTLAPDKPKDRSDVKFCVELGMMLMLDKPIILIVRPGSQVPAKLAKVADAIVEADPGSPTFEARLRAALTTVTEGQM